MCCHGHLCCGCVADVVVFYWLMEFPVNAIGDLFVLVVTESMIGVVVEQFQGCASNLAVCLQESCQQLILNLTQGTVLSNHGSVAAN